MPFLIDRIKCTCSKLIVLSSQLLLAACFLVSCCLLLVLYIIYCKFFKRRKGGCLVQSTDDLIIAGATEKLPNTRSILPSPSKSPASIVSHLPNFAAVKLYG